MGSKAGIVDISASFDAGQYGTLRFPNLTGVHLTEGCRVARASLEHLGKKYRITREMTRDFIDCSTVVSQSHWIGAAVQTPFIADTQRQASNAIGVDAECLIAGDAVYAYESAKSSPGGRYNHVGLVLGSDESGIHWAIESSDPVGVRIVPLDSLRIAGGYRRFCPNALDVFRDGPWCTLVRRVPKLGRLGSRLTAGYFHPSRAHRGTDIYCSDVAKASSPFTCTIVRVDRLGSVAHRVFLYADATGDVCVFGPLLDDDRHLNVGARLIEGSALGTVAPELYSIGCNHLPGYRHRRHLHVEHWSRDRSMPSPAPTMKMESALDIPNIGDFMAVSPLYSLKLHKLKDFLTD